MDADPDLQLVKRCQSGDLAAFDVLVCEHKDRIYRLVCRILGGVEEADDVAQEVFLRAYRKIDDFHCLSSFSTWLTRIAVNYCINHIRSQRRFRLILAGIFPREDRSCSTNEPQAVTEYTEKCEKIHQAINSLAPKQKISIILHYFEEYSCGEIAGILDCSVGTVKSRLFHARRELKKRLEPYLGSGEWINSNSETGGEGYEMFKM